MSDQLLATTTPEQTGNVEAVIRQGIDKLVRCENLEREETNRIFTILMTGGASESQIAALLVGLRMKGETVAELTGAVQAMRSLMLPVQFDGNAVDIVGTGGDGANLLNISTAAAMVCAAAGMPVAKHGNRSVSSKSGSADLLEAAGVFLELDSGQVTRCLETMGIGFMFATQHHPAMRFAAPVRRALGIRTIFNLLGPLTNPAGAKRQLIGVYDARWCEPVVQVLASLGSERVMAVHSGDGLDELSLAAPSQVVELKDGETRSYTLTPEQAGLQTAPIDVLKVKDAAGSLELLNRAFGKKRDTVAETAAAMIAYNAGAALYTGGRVNSIKHGVDLAQDVIYGGQAAEKLASLAHFTRTLQQTAQI